MLSRKQAWRRQIKHIHRLHPDAIYEECGNNVSSAPSRTQSEPTFYQSLFYLGKAWSTTGDLASHEKPDPKKQRCIKFMPSVKVVLIPRREEYVAAGLDSLIWWCDSDYSQFKSSAVQELRELMALDSRIDSVQARRILYQPHAGTLAVHGQHQQRPGMSTTTNKINISSDNNNNNNNNSNKLSVAESDPSSIPTDLGSGMSSSSVALSSSYERALAIDKLMNYSPGHYKALNSKRGTSSSYFASSFPQKHESDETQTALHPLAYMCV